MGHALRIGLFGLLLLATAAHARAAEFFVAPDGSDGDPGTREKPFATVQRAQEAAAPGDTVFIRGGTYVMKEGQIARRRGIFAYVSFLDRRGTPDRRINYWAYQDERPVFDFSAVKPAGVRVDAFYVGASWVHIKGLEVIGVQVTLRGHTQSICFENDGSHNIFERLSMHDGQAIGIYSVRGSDNLFLNCDAYRNRDVTSEDCKGGNVDGFGCHPPEGGTGNVFRGCRAWFNSDDGFDCIGAREPVTFENCWSSYNGYSTTFERLADGNGFKAGGYGSAPADRLPRPIPRHQVRFCLAVGNKAAGFYANHHPGGGDWFNNTGYRNGTDFNMLGRLADNRTDVDGYGHAMRNNVAYKGRAEISRLDPSRCDADHNSFTLGLAVRDADFVNLDECELVRPRQANGDLPAIGFLHPAPGSVLIDKGVDVGFPFRGAAPDLGAFER
jgi:Right handed beta helix region